MTFNELLNLASQYESTGTLDGLGKAKCIIDNLIKDYGDKITAKERERLAETSARLVSEIGDLLPWAGDDDEDDDDDGIVTIVVPAGK
jgi:hypothetical protein